MLTGYVQASEPGLGRFDARHEAADEIGFGFVIFTERLEHFGADGAPARSWLRLRLARVGEDDAQAAAAPQLAPSAAGPEGMVADTGEVVHQVVGGGSDLAGTGERLEDIAFQYYGDPSAWRIIATANAIADPGRVPAGTLLRIPPSPAAGGGL